MGLMEEATRGQEVLRLTPWRRQKCLRHGFEV